VNYYGPKSASACFIHFVENIFKHGEVNKKEHPAMISIQVTDDHIVETSNKISTSEQYTTSGIGKENLERRLSAIYKGLCF
jgi:LytS/YehU family sensor histidine kinase